MDLESLAWRAVELAVQRRHDPRLIVASRPTIAGPTSTARLIAGLCNAAAGRRAIALFGVDGTDVVGVVEVPDETWLDTLATRFPGLVPTLATATIDADGARIVALTADDPGTLVVATRAGRAVIPWFDGTLADRPPVVGVDGGGSRPAGRLEVCSGWLERTDSCALDPVAPTAGTDAASDGSGDANETDTETDTGVETDSGVVVWRGVLDIALALDTLTAVSGVDAGAAPADAAATTAPAATVAPAADGALLPAGSGASGIVADGPMRPVGRPTLRRSSIAIADRDVSVTLLADGSAAALSLDVQVHPTPGAAAAIRSDGGVSLDPLVACRLYLAAAAGAPVFDQSGDLGGAVRLLVSLRFPGDDRLVATMATLDLDLDRTAATRRWTL